MRLRLILFVAFSFIAVIPVLSLAGWVYQSALDREISGVTDKHLILAKNVGGALERYTRDLKLGFEMVAQILVNGSPDPAVLKFLAKMNFVHLCVADLNTGDVISELVPESLPCPARVPEKRFSVFKKLLKIEETVFSPVMPNPKGNPTLYLLRTYGDRLVIGAVTTDYVVAQGKSIAFGKRGHAAIVDQTGSLLAHPLPDWRRSMKNIAKLSPVKRMLAQETGTITFFSPALKADMVAGFTFVPTPGWGVMIPQPFSELRDDALQVRVWAISISAAGIVGAGILTWFLSGYLVGPLASVVAASRRMADGDLNTRVETGIGFKPIEIRELSSAFNTMAEGIESSNARISDALVQAEEGTRAKTNFLTTISHEIRTPMNGVLGVSEMLLSTELSQDQQEMADLIHDSAQNLLGIVSDVLDMAKIEAGRMELEVEPVNIAGTVRAVESEFAQMAANKELRFDIELDDKVPAFVMTDPMRLRQILTNLVGNAIKFTSNGGVSIRVRREPLTDIEDRLVFAIRDTGLGMSSDVLERLFVPFSQADASTTRRFGGTGLGLSISLRLAKLLDGEITVESVPGDGSTFRLILPLAQHKQSALAEKLAEASVSSETEPGLNDDGEHYRVLVAEDHQTNQWLVRRQLEQLGYLPDVHDDGEQALAAYKRGEYDLVLTDYLMPKMDGIDLTRAIRRLEAAKGERIPIIGLTANAFRETLEKCSEAGMDDVITKPTGKVALGEVLSRYVGGSASTPIGFDPTSRRAELDVEEGDEARVAFTPEFCMELFEDEAAEGIAWLRSFLSTMSAQLEAIRGAYDGGDLREASIGLHRLAGAALSVGAMRLGQDCKLLHNEIFSGKQNDDTADRVASIEATAREAEGLINEFITQLQAKE